LASGLTKTGKHGKLVLCFDDHRHSFIVGGWRSLYIYTNPAA
jgi:hypothetical protein